MATDSELIETDLESFTIIWLDTFVNESENLKTQNQLGKLSKQLKIFDNRDAFELYIQSISITEHIVLIVSGRLGREIVPQIHKIEQIISIYVYCSNKKLNEEWSKIYSKIKGVLTTQKELIEQIRLDHKKEMNEELFYINIYKKDLDCNNQFIHLQLLIDYLIKIKIVSIIDTKFLSLCQTECIENSSQMNILKEFQENYSAINILPWIIKEKFLRKLFSKIIHTRNIDLIYLFRFFIRDINQQLELKKCSSSIHVYHSHFITNEQLEQLNKSIGELISIDTFLLTTFQRDKALGDLKQSNNLQKILFDILADPSVDGIKPFSDITSWNNCSNQSQILFMLGSIFRIANIYQQDDIWICQMNLSSVNDQDLKDVSEQMKTEDEDYDTELLAFANILARIGEYGEGEKYYQRLLNELPSDHQDIHICYHNLGNIAYLQGDYDKSLEYHSKSLDIKIRLLKLHDPSIADSYNCLGIVYFNKTDYKQAIDSFTKALNILKVTTIKNDTKMIVCLNNIGLVYRMEKDYSKSLDYYQKALAIDKQNLTEDLGQAYHTIGALYWCLGCYDDAMEYYKSSLENKSQYLSANHPSIAMTLENIGLIYENKNQYQQAFDQYEKAEKIYRQTLSSIHSDVIQIQENIRRVSIHLK